MNNEELVSVMASESFDRAALAMNLGNGKQLFGDCGKKKTEKMKRVEPAILILTIFGWRYYGNCRDPVWGA